MDKIGSFKVVSGNINVGDPCYSGDKSLKAKNGKWEGFVEYSDEGNWGTRVAVLETRHADCSKFPFVTGEEAVLGVDSGQMCVVDESISPKTSEELYDDICKGTLRKCQHTVINDLDDDLGVASSTGFGDGCYPLYVAKNNKDEVIAVKVIFIDEKEEYEDEDEY